jgi:hypothetical protein
MESVAVTFLFSNFGRQVDSAHIHKVFDLLPLHAALQLALLRTIEPGIASCQLTVTKIAHHSPVTYISIPLMLNDYCDCDGKIVSDDVFGLLLLRGCILEFR